MPGGRRRGRLAARRLCLRLLRGLRLLHAGGLLPGLRLLGGLPLLGGLRLMRCLRLLTYLLPGLPTHLLPALRLLASARLL